MNIDPLEVKKFDHLAQHWWDTKGPCRPLHELNPLRLQFIQSGVMLGNQHIVDVGCGGGILTESLSHSSPFVTGIDQSQEALDVAKAHAKSLSQPPQYLKTTIEEHAQTCEKADVVTCMELLEHVPSPQSIIQAISQCLKPSGHAFFSTLNRTPKAYLLAIVGAEYLLRMLPRGTHDYAKFILPSELVEWASACGLKVKRLKGLSYHPLFRRFSLSEDVSVNYLVHFQKEAT